MFKLTQNQREKELLELIPKFADIIKIIIPMFKFQPIQGIKQLDYQDKNFCKVAAFL